MIPVPILNPLKVMIVKGNMMKERNGLKWKNLNVIPRRKSNKSMEAK